MKFQNCIFIILLLSICIINSKSENVPDIYGVISFTLNGTAAYTPLEYTKHTEKYIYYSFDFKYHNKAVSDSKNIAYFYIESDFDLNSPNQENIQFGFSPKIWHKIKNHRDLENIEWKNINYRHRSKQYNNIGYSYKVQNKDDKMNTLLIRVPKNGKTEGYVTVENFDE